MAAQGVGRYPGVLLVGRERERAVLDAALARTVAGRGGCVLVAGEPGIGKTSLVEAVAAEALQAGAAVAWSSVWQDDGAPAYWPLRQLLRVLGDDAERAADLLAGAGGHGPDRFALFDAVGRALVDAARRHPVVLVVDDLHWADSSTLQLLRFLVRELLRVPVLLVATYRDTEVDAALAGFLADVGAGVERLELSGLPVRAVAELLSATAGLAATEQAAALVHARTAGNPFFVTQVAPLLSARPQAAVAESAWPLPASVRDVVARRLARLSQDCHRLLQHAAVIGTEFDADVLARSVDRPRTQLRPALDEACAARVLVTADELGLRFRFAHALLRDVLYGQVDPPRLRDSHRRVADALEVGVVRDERLGELAHHFLRAGDAPAASKGAAYAVRAGRHALSVHAYEDAAGHFARALGALDPDDAEQRAEVLLALGDARVKAGDWPAGAEAFEEAAGLARKCGRGVLLACAALGRGADVGGFEVRVGDRRQLALIEEALEALGGHEPALRAWLLARWSVTASTLEPLDRRRERAAEAVAAGRDSGDGAALVYALSAWCDAHAGPADVEARLAAATEMLRVAEQAGDAPSTLLARRFRVSALLEQGAPSVHTEIDAFRRAAADVGTPLYAWYAPLFQGMQALMGGRLADSEVFVDEAERLGRRAQSVNAAFLVQTQRAQLEFERGHLEALRASMAGPLRLYAHIPNLQAFGARLDAALGRTAQARAVLDRFAAGALADVPVDAEWLPTLAFLAEAAVATRHEAAARALYADLQPHAERFVVDGIAAVCFGSVGLHLGQLAALLGDDDAAAGHFEQAMASNRRLGAVLPLAHTEIACARFLFPRGEPARAQALWDAGCAVLEELGLPAPAPADAPAAPAAADEPVFRREGDVWTVGYGGRTVRLPHAKGLADLACLLARPGREVAAVDLLAAQTGQALAVGRGDDVLDDRARQAYRRRLADLDAELAESEAHHDLERVARARAERDALVDEIAAAAGLGGRRRRMGDDVDRARRAVTMRIRNSIQRLERDHPELARHLQRSVRTGTFCAYEPEQPVAWVT